MDKETMGNMLKGMGAPPLPTGSKIEPNEKLEFFIPKKTWVEKHPVKYGLLMSAAGALITVVLERLL